MLKKIKIQNFKVINSIEIECNDKFNVIMGENNSGKTTIFDAIHFWKICYDECIQKSDKKSFYSQAKNINFNRTEYLRVFDDKDLLNKRKSKDIEIALTIEFEKVEFELGFNIQKVGAIDNAYLQVSYIDKNQFKEFSNMVKKTEFDLFDVIVLCETRPISNIVVKEPYMYKRQVSEKISQGKGYEVLRNKIIKSIVVKEQIESHLMNVMGTPYKFHEVDKDNRAYITLNVNGNNILAQGSGFLQVVEIFASLEYTKAGMYILLIDEPDSHLHLSLQKNLINELRTIQNSQTFIITHNERFLSYIPDQEILHISKEQRDGGYVRSIKPGTKYLLLENLVGELVKIDMLPTVDKVIMVEGKDDITFFTKLLEKYKTLHGKEQPLIHFIDLNGIDTLNEKLIFHTKAYQEIIPESASWIIIIDSDFLLNNMKQAQKENYLRHAVCRNKDLYFQIGYGLESSFLTELDKFAELLMLYYELPSDVLEDVIEVISVLVSEYCANSKNVISNIHLTLCNDFDVQSKRRKYKHKFHEFLRDVSEKNIEVIMTKKILQMFLESFHLKISEVFDTKKGIASFSCLKSIYFDNLTIDSIFQCHKELVELLVEEKPSA